MKQDPNQREISFSRYDINTHCSPSRDVEWVVHADNGWYVDMSSINLKATRIGEKSVYHGHEASRDHIRVTGRLVNHGSCWWWFKDARGFLEVKGTYIEKRRLQDRAS